MPYLQSQVQDNTGEAETAVAREIRRRIDTYPIFDYVPTEVNQKKFHLSPGKERWVFAASKVGKSMMGAAEVVMICLHIHPAYKKPGPQKALIISTDFTASELVAQAAIFAFLPPDSPDVRNWNASKHTLYLKDGGLIHFSSSDKDPLTFEGADWDVIWIDEETKRKIYIAVKRGLVARGGILFGTMTPVQGLTWTYREIQKRSKPPVIFSGEGWSIYDNPYLSPDEISEFEGSLSEAEKAIRLFGRWMPLAGRPVFDLEMLAEVLKRVYEPRRTQLVPAEDGKKVGFIYNPESALGIFQMPVRFHRYIIFGDCAEGDSPEGKYQAGVVLDRDAFEIAAVYHSREKPRVYAQNLELLGEFYNEALLAIEMNPGGSGSVVLEVARDYPNLYYRQVYDEESHRYTKKVGWRTTSANRHLLIAGCHTALKDKLGIHSRAIIEDFSNFIYVEGGGQKAQEGAFDDLVIATGGAMQLHQETFLRPLKEVKEEYEKKHKKVRFDGYKPDYPTSEYPGWLTGT